MAPALPRFGHSVDHGVKPVDVLAGLRGKEYDRRERQEFEFRAHQRFVILQQLVGVSGFALAAAFSLALALFARSNRLTIVPDLDVEGRPLKWRQWEVDVRVSWGDHRQVMVATLRTVAGDGDNKATTPKP